MTTVPEAKILKLAEDYFRQIGWGWPMPHPFQEMNDRGYLFSGWTEDEIWVMKNAVIRATRWEHTNGAQAEFAEWIAWRLKEIREKAT